MSTTTAEVASTSATNPIRLLSALTGVAIIVDAVSVGAPGLGLAGIPFLIAAVGLRTGRLVSCIALALWSALWVFLSISYAAANGVDAGWGDIVGVYLGGTLAAAIVVLCTRHLIGRDR